MQSARVRYVTSINCFVQINFKCLSNLGRASVDGTCVRLSWQGNENNVVLWAVHSNILEGSVGLNSLFANKLGLNDGDVVFVSTCPSPGVLKRVYIATSTEEDYEILLANFEKLQLSLLDQIKVVNSDSFMVVWVSPSLPIFFKSTNDALLKENTEIVVNSNEFSNHGIDKVEECETEKINQDESVQTNKSETKKLILKSYMFEMNQKISKQIIPEGETYLCKPFRLTSIEIPSEDCHNDFSVYIREGILDSTDNIFVLCRMRPSTANSEDELEKEIYVRVRICRQNATEVHHKYFPIYINDKLKDILNIDYGEIITMKRYTGKLIEPDVIEVLPMAGNSFLKVGQKLENIFKSYVISNTKVDALILNNGTSFNLTKDVSCHVNILPESCKFCLVNADTIRNIKIVISENLVQNMERIDKGEKQTWNESEMCYEIECFNSIIQKCIKNMKADMLIKDNISNGSFKNKSHVLIIGGSGSGKTTLCGMIADQLKMYSLRLKCRSIKGKKNVIEILRDKIDICERHCPSILILDDIESIIPCEVEGMANQDTNFFETVLNSLHQLLLQCKNVNVIMTAESIESIHANFHTRKGFYLYTSVFTIPELKQEEKLILLKFLVKNSMYGSYTTLDRNFSGKCFQSTSGTVREIVDYVTRTLFKAAKDSVNDRKNIEPFNDLDSKDSIDNDNSNLWDHIGGLESTKKMLYEILFWPLKYPNLFPKQPGGVLLYGAPGTGKSLLGSSLAKLSKISFLCVKGPELLSKYIGQSEQAVREVFKKAEKKRPCILFFDEFDSLAPKRGHDSTGVTDRVVNQFLTQLDGVEGTVKGVTVIAATSRPDLLDGALLRPGRFDTYINCAMPTRDERLSIFKILSSNLSLADDVDFESLADATVDFTGADIKSILSTAQLTCIEEQLDQYENVEEVNEDSIKITQKHLMDAMKETRPSLTERQLQFYKQIYSRFLGSSNAVDADQDRPRQRATLA